MAAPQGVNVIYLHPYPYSLLTSAWRCVRGRGSVPAVAANAIWTYDDAIVIAIAPVDTT